MNVLLLAFSTCLAMYSDPPPVSVAEHVDLIEVNHYYDDGGKPVFDQLIFYNWDEAARRYNVCAWRLLKNPNQLPIRNPRNGMYYCAWHDGKLLRSIEAAERVETWTQYDPETHERAFLPKGMRTDLLRVDLRN